MTRQKQTSAAEIEIQEILTTDEQLLASCRKLARLRSNLKALQVEISDKILNGVQDCQKTCAVALSSVGEANAAFTNQNE